MSYSKRLKKLSSAWQNDEPAEGFTPIPPGTYQFEVVEAKLQESQASFNKGNLQVVFRLRVLTGQHKGKEITKYIDLESDGDATRNIPSGRSILKGDLTKLGINLPKNLTEKSLLKALNEALDCVIEGAVVEKNGFSRVYINRLVNDSSEIEEDEDDEEEEEEDEVEEEEEEEEKPKKKAKKQAKKSKKKVEEVEEEEEEEEDEEEEAEYDADNDDEEDDEDDEDDEEEDDEEIWDA